MASELKTNNENEVADVIDYDVSNIDLNDDFGNFVLPEGLTPENRTKMEGLRFAVFIAQTGIKFTRRKNVLSPYEEESHVKCLQNCKVSLHIDELTELVQKKKWMTLQTLYVDEETMDARTELLSLLL